jgi:outer membrane protein assembly factor BamB/tetratricopeptide (TPR) repeat protein
MSLTGQIEEMGLGAVIQTLSLNSYRGTLRIETEDAGSQFFFISEGAIVLIRQVKRDPVRLGDLLIRAGKITLDDLKSALATQKQTKLRLGEQLVADGLVQQDEIERVIQGKFEEDFLDLFMLDKGRFEFIFGLTPEALFAPDEKLERVTLNTSGLMLEAMRRVDEWQEMINSLGSLDTIFSNQGRAPSKEVLEADVAGIALLPEARRKLYGFLEGQLSLREVLGHAISQRVASRLETFLFLHHLCESKAVQPLDTKTLLSHARGALSAKDVPKAAKFIRAILGRKGQLEIGLIKRYLEFLRKNQRPKLAFDEARMFAGQALARGETAQAIALYEEAVALDFRNLEVIDRLFYALLRDNQRQRAIDVGLMLRDYLSSADGDMQVATRIVRNLKELDPENPEVLELSGRVLSRKEQNEQAIAELERALERAPEDHPRRGAIVSALLALQPDREDLRAEQESIEVREARLAVQREFRRRMLVVSTVPTLVILALLVVWRAYFELQASGFLAEAKALHADGPDEDFEDYEEASRLLTLAQLSGWIVRGEAEALQGEVDADIAAYHSQRQSQVDDEIRGRLAAAEAREREEQQRLRLAQLGAALAEYKLYVSRRDWSRASAKALEIRAKFTAEEEPRVGELTVFVELSTDPAGATVFQGAEELGVTPLAVGVVPGHTMQVEVRLPGFRPLSRELTPDGHEELALLLEAGPSWAVNVSEPPLVPATWEQGVVVATPGGRVSSLAYADGSLQWALETPDAFAARSVAVPSQLTWAQVLSGRLACGGDGSVLSVDLGSGAVRWAREVGGEGERSFGRALQVGGEDYVAFARGSRLSLLDARTGETAAQVQLPAAVVATPAYGSRRLFVPLAGNKLVALTLEGGTLTRAWEAAGVPASAPVYAGLPDAVLFLAGEVVRGFEGPDGATFELKPELGPLHGLVVLDDRAYLATSDGSLTALRIPDAQLLVPGTKVAPAIVSGPTVVEGDVYVADGQGAVRRLDRDGRQRGRGIELGAPVTAPLCEAAGGRLVAVADRTVLLIEPAER